MVTSRSEGKSPRMEEMQCEGEVASKKGKYMMIKASNLIQSMNIFFHNQFYVILGYQSSICKSVMYIPNGVR